MAEEPDLIALTADIVSAFVEGNKIATDDLPALIASAHASLAKPGAEAAPAEPAIKLTSAQIRKSITPTGLVSFEDGKTYQTLKRHLTIRGMTLQDIQSQVGLAEGLPNHGAGLCRQALRPG